MPQWERKKRCGCLFICRKEGRIRQIISDPFDFAFAVTLFFEEAEEVHSGLNKAGRPPCVPCIEYTRDKMSIPIVPALLALGCRTVSKLSEVVVVCHLDTIWYTRR